MQLAHVARFHAYYCNYLALVPEQFLGAKGRTLYPRPYLVGVTFKTWVVWIHISPVN